MADQKEAPRVDLIGHYERTVGLPDPREVLQRNPPTLPGLTGEIPQLAPAQMEELQHGIDRTSGIYNRTVAPDPENPDEIQAAREFDEAERAMTPGKYVITSRITHKPIPQQS